MPRLRTSLWPSNVKFTSSMPWRSAHAPNSASAPAAAPLKRMKSVFFMVPQAERDLREALVVVVEDAFFLAAGFAAFFAG